MEQVIQMVQMRLSALLPPSVTGTGAELSDQIKQVLKEAMTKFDLVSRDEFMAQSAALERAKSRLAAIESRVKALESLLETERL